jgi:hypothetical protein
MAIWMVYTIGQEKENRAVASVEETKTVQNVFSSPTASLFEPMSHT